jgi:hypothetical protein
MNPDYEKQLESDIDRELQLLPELQAPAELTSRVMERVRLQASGEWYRQPLQNWPLAYRATGLAVLVSVFCLICLVLWAIPYSVQFDAAKQNVTQWLAPVTALFQTAKVLCATLLSTAKYVNTWFLVAWAAIALIAYAMCVGFGTALFRYATARR